MPRLLRPGAFTTAAIRLRPSSFPARARQDALITLHLRNVLIASSLSVMLIVTGPLALAQPIAVQRVSPR